MAVTTAVQQRAKCPRYCTTDHRLDADRHEHHIAEVLVPHGHVAVNLVRSDDADEIELTAASEGAALAVTQMTADEARSLRDALNVAVVLLDRT